MIESFYKAYPSPSDYPFRPRKSLHGRAPKDQRGDRNRRARDRIMRSLYTEPGLKSGRLAVTK